MNNDNCCFDYVCTCSGCKRTCKRHDTNKNSNTNSNLIKNTTSIFMIDARITLGQGTGQTIYYYNLFGYTSTRYFNCSEKSDNSKFINWPYSEHLARSFTASNRHLQYQQQIISNTHDCIKTIEQCTARLKRKQCTETVCRNSVRKQCTETVYRNSVRKQCTEIACVQDPHRANQRSRDDILQDLPQIQGDVHNILIRMPFSRRPTSRLPIESQTLTIWPWNDLDLGMTLISFITLTSDNIIPSK